MKLINIIKNVFIAARNTAVATANGAGTITNGDPGARQLIYGKVPLAAKTVTPAYSTALVGEITPEHLSNFQSARSKQAVAGLGCWSALARGFSLFMKESQQHPSRQNWDKVYNALNEFHAWNAACSEKSSGYFVNEQGEAYGENLGFSMSDEDVELTIAKMAVLPLPRGDDETDAILAEVRKCSVDQLRKEREDDINTRSKKRLALVQEFCQMVWQAHKVTTVEDENGDIRYEGADNEMECSMPVSKALNKLASTLTWVASWKLDPAAAAAECLLIKDDIQWLQSTVHNKNQNREGISETTGRGKNPRFDAHMSQASF